MVALGRLYEGQMQMVYTVAFKYLKDKMLAEDMVMQVFETVMVKAKTHNISNFKGWLYMVTKNACLMQLRKKKNIVELDNVREAQFVEFDSLIHLNGEPNKEEKFKRLEHCMNKLSAEQRQSIKLFYYEQKSYQQIAEATGFNIKKVKSYIQNGKRNLKICVDSFKTEEEST